MSLEQDLSQTPRDGMLMRRSRREHLPLSLMRLNCQLGWDSLHLTPAVTALMDGELIESGWLAFVGVQRSSISLEGTVVVTRASLSSG